LKSSHYFGIESSEKPTKVPIKIQKINESIYSYNPNTFDLSDEIFNDIRSSRSPVDAIEYYMDNSPDIQYLPLNNEDILDVDAETTDYNINRFTYSLAASGGGFKIFFFKLKDKAGNESNIYSASLYIQGSQTITHSNEIKSVTIQSDDRLMIVEDIVNIFENDHKFLTNLMTTDTKNNRSIVIRDIIVEDENGDLVNHPYFNNLLVGFSDTYGLNYNVYSPISSISTWNFKRPVPIKMKGFGQGYKGPDWFFDPNDVRHYISDSSEDYTFGIGSNNNITGSQSFHIPSNPGLKSRTLIGFLDEPSERYARSNPVAKKIYENKEEVIGKYLSIGSLPSIKFKILDVFKSDSIAPAKRFNSSGEEIEENYADPDGGSASGQGIRKKIWILIEDEEAVAALILSRKFQYITEENPSVYDVSKSQTGWRDDLKKEFVQENYIENFGYYLSEEDIPESANIIVNDSLHLTKNITTDPDNIESGDNLIPLGYDGTSDLYIYIDCSDFDDISSGISSNEGWTTRIYQGYSQYSSVATSQKILESLQHHQLLGINYYDKMIFGDSYVIEANILKVSYNSITDETYVLFSESGIDYTMRNIEYSIVNPSGEEVDLGDLQQEIKNVSVNGDVISLYGDNVYLSLNPDEDGYPDGNYKLRITIDGLDYKDESDNTEYGRGWWPKIEGLLIPPVDQKIGSQESLWDKTKIKFCTISTGSFYIPKDGEYYFKIEKDNFSYADFSIDFFGKDVDRYVAENEEYVLKTTSINLTCQQGVVSSEKSVYLLRGWHTARFRCRTDNNTFEIGRAHV
jgi:hypothetical protein